MEFKDHFKDIKHDMWQHLAVCQKPIALYGMGDGADKIVSELEKRGMFISGIFASDGFVPKKEKIVYGHKVESYSSVKKRLGNMVVLVCFGTKLPDVIENILKISDETELYAPDVPVFGNGIFDLGYFTENFGRLENIYRLLADNASKKAFVCSIKYRLTGDIKYLFDCETDPREGFREIFAPKSGSVYIDVGAYNGDTVREFSYFSGSDISVHAFEPDARNFKKLSAYAQDCGIRDIHLYNLAAWDKNEDIMFYSRSGRNSAETTSHSGAKSVVIHGARVDSLTDKADFIKIDAEGSDKKALLGMSRIISEHAPAMCVAAYHRTEDYFDIPECVLSMYDGYDMLFRHSRHIPCWDTNFYFVKRGRNK